MMILALKQTKIRLELMTDYDMVLFFNAGLRGGTSFMGHQYARANIKNSPFYNPNLPEEVLLPLDATNLYGKIK